MKWTKTTVISGYDVWEASVEGRRFQIETKTYGAKYAVSVNGKRIGSFATLAAAKNAAKNA